MDTPYLATLAERIEHIVENSEYGSARGLARAAGLSAPYLANLRRRLKTKPSQSIGIETAQSLAEAAGVPTEWLVTGKVSEGKTKSSLSSLDIAIMLAEDAKLPESIIKTARAEARYTPGEKTVQHWQKRLLELHAAKLEFDSQFEVINQAVGKIAT